MAKFVFYCRVDRSTLDAFEYYKQDIDALEALGHEVVVCTKYREIPHRFDAMFIWWWTYALLPVLLCRLLRRPCLITGAYNFRFPTGFDGTDYLRRPYWQRWLIGRATSLCSLNLFINEAELHECASHFKIRTARYYPCIVHADYLRGPVSERTSALFNVAWSGRQNLIRKGIPELLHAVRLLKDEGLNIRLNLAGLKGDGADFLLGAVTRLGLADVVTCLGPLTRADKIARLRTCDVYVQPSHYEGFGLAIAEAMGCGACVIVCDVGAVRAVVGDCGVYVVPGSPAELARAIKAVLDDADMRRCLQGEAHRRASQLFTPDSKVERLRALLREVGVS